MNPAAWAWVGLAVLIVAWVAGFDVWAHFAGAQSMSGRFHDWLHEPLPGTLITGLVSGTLGGLIYHLITTPSH